MSDVFISYARSSATQAQQVAEALRALGYSVWRDDDLPAHKPYAEVIQERLDAARAVVVLWSAEAVKSQWVFSEANRAREHGKLVQLSLEVTPLPMPFDSIQCAELAGWAGDLDAHDWRKVVASVGELVGRVQPAPAIAAPRTHSICVLPFANMSGDPEQEYFSDGISEDIITDLSKVSSLSVVARNTAFTFKGKSVRIPEVARDLNVSHVLEGSVRKAGARVRITAQLVDGAAGDHIWAERYDRDLTDIFALQDAISRAIVEALKVKLLPQEKQAIAQRGTDSVEAYNLYLMARSYWRAAADGDPRQFGAMVRLCQRAVEIDPDYAQAWALLASGQFYLHRNHGRMGDGGEAAVARAAALDPDLAEARAIRARMLCNAGRSEAAAAEIAIALELDPQSFEVNFHAGSISYEADRFGEAVRYLERAATLVETDLRTSTVLLSCYKELGDRDNTERVARIALAKAEKAIAQDRSNCLAMDVGVAALAALGERDRALDWMNRALLIEPDNWGMRYNFACALALWLDSPDAALEMLGSALEADARWLMRIVRYDVDLASLRGDPRFNAMITAAQARLAAAKPADGAGPSESAYDAVDGTPPLAGA